MSLLRSALTAPLRASARASAVPRSLSAAGSSRIMPMSRTLASTSLRYQEVSAERPQPVAPEKSTYKAILASLTDSLQQKRGPRSSGSSYNEAEDNEAQWETRPVFGEASWPATPYSGRSILVGSDNDVNRAYSSLSSLMARNQVRRELKLTERFEKPNRERNRKKSERHRRRFADMVRKKVQLVMAIKSRGA